MISVKHKRIRDKIQYGINELTVLLDRQLSMDYLTFEVHFGSKTFNFNTPTTVKERERWLRNKKTLINLLLMDAFKQALRGKPDWSRIEALFTNIPTKREIVSKARRVLPSEWKTLAEKSKSLDYDNAQVIMQNQKMTDEQITNMLMDKFAPVLERLAKE